jgi:hypothetical protein
MKTTVISRCRAPVSLISPLKFSCCIFLPPVHSICRSGIAPVSFLPGDPGAIPAAVGQFLDA